MTTGAVQRPLSRENTDLIIMYCLSVSIAVFILFSNLSNKKALDLNLHRSFLIVQQVTSKGTGLNPNAKVWQEIPSGNPDGTPVTESTWHETAATSGSHPEGKS